MPRESSEANVLQMHPAIWVLYRDTDGERSMTYDGAKVKCANCDGWEDGTVCPQGCGVEIVSNQYERTERYQVEMREQEAERKRWRAEMKAEREQHALGQKQGHSDA